MQLDPRWYFGTAAQVSDGMYGKLAEVASRREVYDLQMELKNLRGRGKTQTGRPRREHLGSLK